LAKHHCLKTLLTERHLTGTNVSPLRSKAYHHWSKRHLAEHHLVDIYESNGKLLGSTSLPQQLFDRKALGRN
jgi:hypothetical protein